MQATLAVFLLCSALGSASEDSSHPLTIKLFTKDTPEAGTDSDVYIQLSGSGGFPETHVLDGSWWTNEFERGDCDEFTLAREGMDPFPWPPTAVKLALGDPLWFNPAWDVYKLVVMRDEEGDAYVFECANTCVLDPRIPESIAFDGAVDVDEHANDHDDLYGMRTLTMTNPSKEPASKYDECST